MRFITWLKILIFLLVIALLTVFFIQNTGPVAMHFPFSRPYHFGLIYILLIAYFLGVLTAVLAVFMISARAKKKKTLEESKDLVEEEG
ncbi:MAG: DUF1049 domain-containing protein [Candidatus Omnitrophica bacterium]|nr:DUF1049 domain-containing protein [Candidatus Omnitrophota bacterium]